MYKGLYSENHFTKCILSIKATCGLISVGGFCFYGVIAATVRLKFNNDNSRPSESVKTLARSFFIYKQILKGCDIQNNYKHLGIIFKRFYKHKT